MEVTTRLASASEVRIGCGFFLGIQECCCSEWGGERVWLFSINISLSLYRFMYMLLYQKVYLMWFCRLVCICQYSLQKGQRYLNTFYQESRQHTFPLHTCPKYTLLISFSLALALVYLFLSLSLHLFTSFNSGSHISQVGLELALLPRMVLNF